MENATVFLVEDNEYVLDRVKAYLERRGHRVVLVATNFDDALRLVKEGKLAEVGVDVAVVDGFLPSASDSGRERFLGPVVARTIRDINGNVKIVSHSSLPADKCNYGDVHAWKGGDDLQPVCTAIASL